MANQAIGLTHIIPNAEFGTVSAGDITGLSATGECIVIPISDLGITASSGGSSYSVTYTDVSGNDTTYTGNGDLFLRKIVGLWNTRFQQIKTDRATDQAKATASQQGTDPEPSACTSNGFTSFSSVGSNLRNSISITFLYDEPTAVLVNDGDV